MKTSIIEVGELLSTLSAAGVDRQLSALPGVDHVGVFYPFTLSPEIAALSMSGSSAVVAVNALMLERTRLAGIEGARQRTALVAGVQVAAAASA